MKILVLGGGGREHALAWRLRQDPDVTDVLAAPGNPGSAAVARLVPADLTDPAGLVALAERERVDLTVVGPEAPLEIGVVNAFRQSGLDIFGPSQKAAALECSKVFAKDFMVRHDIPTAKFVVCNSAEGALAAIRSDFHAPVVVKADGLASGKGVVVAETQAQAEDAVRSVMVDRLFGSAGSRVVIEECLTGPEVSFFALCDGSRAMPLSTAQDHKRIFDGDRGPNTGGMGAFSPSPLIDDAASDFIMGRIVQPVIEGMRSEGEPYVGFLYVGLMLTPHGPRVIEFNVRFGDPEAQVVLPRLQGSLARALQAAARGDISSIVLEPTEDRLVGVVLASRGYPASAESGQTIEGLESAGSDPDVMVFHSGTRREGDRVVTAGGRVLTVVGRGRTYEDAMAAAYGAVHRVSFDGQQFRTDIGRKALQGATEVGT